MKVLTLTQPWATLVAIGAKKIETRSWSTRYRGPLLIHAAKGLGPVGGMEGLRDLCLREPFFSALKAGGINLDRVDVDALPRGEIVARCELCYCALTDTLQGQPWCAYGSQIWHMTNHERTFGDYTSGRYAWLLDNVQALSEPIPAKGQLGLWEFEVPTQRPTQPANTSY